MNEIKFRKWGRYTTGSLGMVDWTILNASNAVDFRLDEGEVLMQYTGLKDNHGTEIYEGDIVKVDEDYQKMFKTKKTEKIVFSCGCFKVGSTLNSLIFFVQANNITKTFLKVIGNIYQNPELIRE